MSIKAEFTIDGETMASLVTQSAAVLELMPPDAVMLVDSHKVTATIRAEWETADEMVREMQGIEP